MRRKLLTKKKEWIFIKLWRLRMWWNGDLLWLSLRRPGGDGGDYPECAIDWWCDLGLFPYFPICKDARSHFQILASGGKGGRNLLLGFAGKRVNSLCIGCLLESTPWDMQMGTQSSQRRQGASGERFSEGPSSGPLLLSRRSKYCI